ncbi:MAG: MerC domain-containing protein [Bacteroidota bacterium]|nr:MerC domain-containing protein [Bacteroidota bacterium]
MVSTLPIFGINIIHNSYFEWGMIIIAFLVGSYSLFHGYIKHHRNNFPVLLFSLGFTFLILKQFFSHQEYLLLFFAVCLILSAHILNFKYCRQSRFCNSEYHSH